MPSSPSTFATMFGCDVAMRRPARSEIWVAESSIGTAACSEHVPYPSRRSTSTLLLRSATRSSPVMPQSTTPSCTYSGTSSARTKRRSMSALRQCAWSTRSPGSCGETPLASSNCHDGSRRRPFDGSAMVSRLICDLSLVQPGNRLRRGVTTVRLESLLLLTHQCVGKFLDT